MVVGLDPNMKFIPPMLFDDAKQSWSGVRILIRSETTNSVLPLKRCGRFNKEIIDSVYDLVPAVKPQIAMYEQFGIAGMKTFWRTVRYCKEKGLIVIGDVKRGDIGSTSEAYARAHLGRVKIGNHDACF